MACAMGRGGGGGVAVAMAIVCVMGAVRAGWGWWAALPPGLATQLEWTGARSAGKKEERLKRMTNVQMKMSR